MVPLSPADALGAQGPGARSLLVDVVRSVHDRFAEAHLVSGSQYALAFGAQWRDLLINSLDAFVDRGFQSHKMLPAGYSLPVVNECLVYVWRIPDSADPTAFASSPTKRRGFSASPPEPMLWEPGLDAGEEASVGPGLESVVRAARDVMPVVLVIVRSSPRQLHSINWAVAELDPSTGKVALHGQETIWLPEVEAQEPAANVESFDSGTPTTPTVELRAQEGTDPDGR